ncbi:uncharacterized protein LOC141607576 [Silene latifolia]|uniref:uncharacterized protein LOC141607576 n=1 Tax=Silene latifolia TaxID=37657 RepID=UPI003D774265
MEVRVKAIAGTNMVINANDKTDADRTRRLEAALASIAEGYGWAVFSEALKKRFYPEEMRWEKEYEFLRLHQGSMTVKEYTNKFMKLSRFVTSVAMDEVSRTCRYKKNLAPKAYDRALSIYDLVLATEAKESAKNKFVKRPYVAPNAPQKKQKFEARPYAPRDQGQVKKDMVCFKCGKAYHPGKYCETGSLITCFTCKASGHKAVDCPQKPKFAAPKADALKTGRVFVMNIAEADVNPDVVTGAILPADLVQFKLGEFDVILFMDWLSRYDARFLCRDQKLVLKCAIGSRISYQGVRVTLTVKWVSALKMVSMGRKGHQIYLCGVRDVSPELTLEDIPVVKEFPVVFPEDLPGIPPE